MKIKYLLIGLLVSISLFLFLGIITALITNPWFVRMIEKNVFDYIFLITSSILLGSYVSIYLYKKSTSIKCETTTLSGFVGSIFSFACPICSKLLVLLFGTTALLTYFEPYRPVLGFLSIGLLSGALYFKLKT